MAMIVYEEPGHEVSGRVGGNIFRWDQCGEHIQGQPRLVQHMSPAQLEQRRLFRACLRYIEDVIRLGYRGEWLNYAARHAWVNKKGDTYFTEWRIWFLYFNVPRLRNGLAVILLPPNE